MVISGPGHSIVLTSEFSGESPQNFVQLSGLNLAKYPDSPELYNR